VGNKKGRRREKEREGAQRGENEGRERQHKDGGKEKRRNKGEEEEGMGSSWSGYPPVCVTTDNQWKEGSAPLLFAALQN